MPSRREILSGVATCGLGYLLGGCKDKDGFIPQADASESCNPDVLLSSYTERNIQRKTPKGVEIFFPSWNGLTEEMIQQTISEVDTIVIKEDDPSVESVVAGVYGTTEVPIGEFIKKNPTWEIVVGRPDAMEINGVLFAGATCNRLSFVICRWVRTANLRDGQHRLDTAEHEYRHALRYSLGLPPCWPGHPTGSGCRPRSQYDIGLLPVEI